MPVDPITPPLPAAPSPDRISSRAEGLDRADFLRMLTAQLRTQDPLNPLSGQDFASQLAQFSSLQELQGIGAAMGQSLQTDLLLAQTFNNTMAATLIGKTIRADVSEVAMGATGEATLGFSLDGPATDITVDIRDADGDIIRTLRVPSREAGDHTFTWDGFDTEGRRVAPGNYSYTVNAKDPDGRTVRSTSFLEGRVTEVRYVDGSPVLIVNGMQVQLGQVLTIGEPDGARKG